MRRHCQYTYSHTIPASTHRQIRTPRRYQRADTVNIHNSTQYQRADTVKYILPHDTNAQTLSIYKLPHDTNVQKLSIHILPHALRQTGVYRQLSADRTSWRSTNCETERQTHRPTHKTRDTYKYNSCYSNRGNSTDAGHHF